MSQAIMNYIEKQTIKEFFSKQIIKLDLPFSQGLKLIGIMKIERQSTIKNFYIDKLKRIHISFISNNSSGTKTVTFYTIPLGSEFPIIQGPKVDIKVFEVPFDYKFKFNTFYTYKK